VAVEQLRRPLCSPPYISILSTNTPGNKLIAITKVKIITLDKACKCDSSTAIGVRGVAISQKVVTLARIRELHIGMEYGTEARRQHIETVPRTSFQLPYIV
jgi:hypothetical protein